MLCFATCILYSDAQNIRILLFLCELSHQQRNTISGKAARYKIFGVNAHKEIIRYNFLAMCCGVGCRGGVW